MIISDFPLVILHPSCSFNIVRHQREEEYWYPDWRLKKFLPFNTAGEIKAKLAAHPERTDACWRKIQCFLGTTWANANEDEHVLRLGSSYTGVQAEPQVGSPEPLQSLDSLISPLFPLACRRLSPSAGKLTVVILLAATNWPPSLTATKKKSFVGRGPGGIKWADAEIASAGGRQLNQSLHGTFSGAETTPPVIVTLPVHVAKLDCVMLSRRWGLFHITLILLASLSQDAGI